VFTDVSIYFHCRNRKLEATFRLRISFNLGLLMMFNIVGIVKLIDGHKTCVIALKNVVMPTQAQEYFAKTRSVLQTPY